MDRAHRRAGEPVRHRRLIVLLGVALTYGCGDDLKVPERPARGERKASGVRGLVTIGGMPLKRGIITYHGDKDFARSADVVDGVYVIPNLRAGTYRVTVENRFFTEGFNSSRPNDFRANSIDSVKLRDAGGESPQVTKMLQDDVKRFRREKSLVSEMRIVPGHYESKSTTPERQRVEEGTSVINISVSR